MNLPIIHVLELVLEIADDGTLVNIVAEHVNGSIDAIVLVVAFELVPEV